MSPSDHADFSHNGQSYNTALRLGLNHCEEAANPIVLVTGGFGTQKLQLVHEIVRSSNHLLYEAASVERPHHMLQRCLRALEESQDGSAYYATQMLEQKAWSPKTDTPRHLVVADADLLDDESLRVLDILVRSRSTGLFMTASTSRRLSYRFARALEARRGLSVTLDPYDPEECRDAIVQTLDVPPTQAFVDYVYRCSRGVPAGIASVLREGVEEGWISTLGDRSVVTRPPAWLGPDSEHRIREEISQQLGFRAAALLETIADSDRLGLTELLSRLEHPDVAFWLEEAGLIRIDGGTVTIHPPVYERALQKYSRSFGSDVDSVRERAAQLIRGGLVGRARIVLSQLPQNDPTGCVLRASTYVLTGAPRRALHHLQQCLATGLPDRDASAVEAAAAFISAVLLERTVDRAKVPDAVATLLNRRRMIDHEELDTYFAAVSPPAQ